MQVYQLFSFSHLRFQSAVAVEADLVFNANDVIEPLEIGYRLLCFCFEYNQQANYFDVCSDLGVSVKELVLSSGNELGSGIWETLTVQHMCSKDETLSERLS